MEARPCQIIEFFNGTKQLLVPLFQRPYEWKRDNWNTLWDDLLERYEHSIIGATHFTGAIVTGPAKSVPVGVSKHLVIDGQQRLTTVAILICAMRSLLEPETPKYRKLTRLLVNEDDEGSDYYKLLPTQSDRSAFYSLVSGTPLLGTKLAEAFEFFRSRLQGKDSDNQQIDIDRMIETLHTQITVVSIHLADTDDPYLIFESLNAKGAPLTQADLIRNYLLLRLHSQAQQEAYETLWVPMQQSLPSEHLSEFMRQHLMMSGEEVSRSEIYSALKRRLHNLADQAVLAELQTMHRNMHYYARIVGLQPDADTKTSNALGRLLRLNVSVATPMLMRAMLSRDNGTLASVDLLKIIDMIESFVVRRMICRVPTNQLKRIFLGLTKDFPASNHLQAISDILQKGQSGGRWPKDEEFRENWMTYRYASPIDRCRLVLETLEESFGHKEPATFQAATIEHLMPQTLSTAWQAELGDDFARVHEQWLDTIGNLTLTAYNAELSNEVFSRKKELLGTSHFELNRDVCTENTWNEATIRARALSTFGRAKSIWPRPESFDV